MLPPVWNYPFTYRAVKGSPLSNDEVDDNFKAVAERAEYAQTVAETLPNEIALTAADAATYAANQIAQSALAAVQAAAADAAAAVTGEWVDLRPYLNAGFFWKTARAGKNSHPRIRKLSCGRVELDGIVSFNETSGPTAVGAVFTVPAQFKPPYTSGGLLFADTAEPLSFGWCNWIVSGEVAYGSSLVHGEVIILPVGLPATSQGGALSLNGIYWFT